MNKIYDIILTIFCASIIYIGIVFKTDHWHCSAEDLTASFQIASSMRRICANQIYVWIVNYYYNKNKPSWKNIQQMITDNFHFKILRKLMLHIIIKIIIVLRTQSHMITIYRDRKQYRSWFTASPCVHIYHARLLKPILHIIVILRYFRIEYAPYSGSKILGTWKWFKIDCSDIYFHKFQISFIWSFPKKVKNWSIFGRNHKFFHWNASKQQNQNFRDVETKDHLFVPNIAHILTATQILD